MGMKRLLTALTGSTLLAVLVPIGASAATNVVATPSNTQGWTTADTRPGGSVQIISDSSSPYGKGALQLTTNDTTAAKAQYMHEANTKLSDVTNLSYATKQNSASFNNGAPSYQLVVLLNGTEASYTTFVYEPYNNSETIQPNAWQSWDVDAGTMWSSRTVNAGGACSVNAGAGGPPFYSLATLKTNCPQAVVKGFGVNIGTYNQNYDVEADGVQFNDTVYDFEPYATPNDKDDCKKDGYKTLKTAEGKSFKNQGDCVSYVASNGRAGGNPVSNFFSNLF